MKLYTVFFGVDHEGEYLEGVFSTLEAALEQVELSKKAHNYGIESQEWAHGWDDDLDDEVWRRSDLYIAIRETQLDRKRYEHIGN